MGDAGVGWIAAIIVGGIAGWLAEQFMKSNMGLIMNRARHCWRGDCQRHFELLRDRSGGMDRLPDFRLHRRGLADLDRPSRTASLRTSEARSAGGVPIDGKWNKGPSQPVFVRCFGERRIWWWECDHDYADTAGNDMPASGASV